MRKKIGVDDVRVGMYLQDVGASWMKNPFWRTSFLITDAKDIALLKASNIPEVWIDTAKGADVPHSHGGSGFPDTEASPLSADFPPASDRSNAPVSMQEELAKAAEICAGARQAVTTMFQEARMGNTVDAAGAGQLVQDISDSVARNASALISLARLKTADDYTYMHSVAVCAMMIALARQLGLDEQQVRAAGEAGLLHDMGKALLPMEVLNKPGKLSEEEFAIVRRHPQLGHDMLCKASGVGDIALDVCLHHHEKMDGTGYPMGLDGDRISLFAKMGAVCDVYDAITSNRPYKEGWDPAESMRKMGQWADGHFDPIVFQAFAKSLGIYPVGSLVRLTSGLLGVVILQNPSALTTPVVKVFFATRTRERIEPAVLDLSERGCRERIVAREDPAKWRFPDLNALWSGEFVPATS
jgi:HD-GYP domain-containing protein (c-di-GMP phosphodiesterase class II)